MEFEKAGDEGSMRGILCTIGNSRQIRFNWKISGGSGNIDSIDIWKSLDLQPDITIITNGLSIPKIIDIIAKTYLTGQIDTYQIEEKVNPESGSKISDKIVVSINAWLKNNIVNPDGSVNIDKLANTRISVLYDDYLYWYNELADDSYYLVPSGSFRNYLVKAFEREGITNVFMRTVKVKKASPEKMKSNPKNEKAFDNALLSMSMRETIDFVKESVRVVTRGYENGVLICGTGGIGKSRLVREVIEEDGVKAKWISGGIRNPEALFNVFKRNNKKDLILIFDDADDLFNIKNIDIMKVVLSPDKIRKISWYKK